jgi:hypothetical protein
LRSFARKKTYGEATIKIFLKKKEIRPKGQGIKPEARYARNNKKINKTCLIV